MAHTTHLYEMKAKPMLYGKFNSWNNIHISQCVSHINVLSPKTHFITYLAVNKYHFGIQKPSHWTPNETESNFLHLQKNWTVFTTIVRKHISIGNALGLRDIVQSINLLAPPAWPSFHCSVQQESCSTKSLHHAIYLSLYLLSIYLLSSSPLDYRLVPSDWPQSSHHLTT